MTVFKNKHGATILLAAALSVSSNSLFSQAFTKYNYAAQSGASLNYKIEPSEKEVEGSPYYNDEWKEATIYNKDNTYAEVGQLKYNVHIDELIFVFKGVQYIIPAKEKIKRFKLGEEEFIGAHDGTKYSFYKVLVPGDKMLLLKGFQCSIVKGQPSKGYIPATKDKLVLKEHVFILKPGNDVVEINPKKGHHFLEYTYGKMDEVEAYIKDNKLKMKNLDDLTAVINHFNTLPEDAVGPSK